MSIVNNASRTDEPRRPKWTAVALFVTAVLSHCGAPIAHAASELYIVEHYGDGIIGSRFSLMCKMTNLPCVGSSHFNIENTSEPIEWRFSSNVSGIEVKASVRGVSLWFGAEDRGYLPIGPAGTGVREYLLYYPHPNFQKGARAPSSPKAPVIQHGISIPGRFRVRYIRSENDELESPRDKGNL